MEKTVVSRDDRVSRAMPDLVRCADDTLLCVFRESVHYCSRNDAIDHLPGKPFSRIIQQRSFNGGRSWSSVETIASLRKDEGMLNCPRLLRLAGGRLLLAVDWIPPGPAGEKTKDCDVRFWRSDDNGVSWQGPCKEGVALIVPAIHQLRDGTVLCGGSIWNDRDEEAMIVYRSGDEGKTWTGPFTVAEKPGFSLGSALKSSAIPPPSSFVKENEASIMYLPSSTSG